MFAQRMSFAALVPSRRERRKEAYMAGAIHIDDPERAIEVMNRNRQLKMYAVVAGIVLALGMVFALTIAMYSEDPAARAVGAPEK